MTISSLILPWDTSTVAGTREVDPSLVEALQALAHGDAEVGSRAESLFMFLRKISSHGKACEYLMGIQHLAVSGDPAGARLLAAFLAVSTPGDRLLPRIQQLSSSRRLNIRIGQDSSDPGQIHQDWLQRLGELTRGCEKVVVPDQSTTEASEPAPGQEPPWPFLRDTLDLLLARLRLGDDFDGDDRQLLVELLRLEVDAWQERISHLAGSIDPFRVAAITRVLPLLSLWDAETRDLRQMIAWIEEGCLGSDFQKPLSRSLDVLEENDRAAVWKVFASDPGLAPLQKLFAGLEEHPVRIPVLAHCLGRLQALASRLSLLGVPGVDLDIVSGALLIQEHFPTDGREEEFSLPLSPGFPRACRHILEMADSGMGAEAADLDGLSIRDEELVIAIPEGGAYLEHDLPAAIPDGMDEDSEGIMAWAGEVLAKEKTEPVDPEAIDMATASITELKHLVMTNIQSISVLLGFLRNPKIVAIPGLVEEVVNRTRNPKVIETIASVRLLHTGFANRGVAMACLRSPVNIPLTVLRKFMHVKYVAKVDLKRMALDKAGIRKEVGKEIKKYLAALT